MTLYDDPEVLIDRLHEEAEDLADLAKHTADQHERTRLRTEARRRVQKAARLRAQIEEA